MCVYVGAHVHGMCVRSIESKNAKKNARSSYDNDDNDVRHIFPERKVTHTAPDTHARNGRNVSVCVCVSSECAHVHRADIPRAVSTHTTAHFCVVVLIVLLCAFQCDYGISINGKSHITIAVESSALVRLNVSIRMQPVMCVRLCVCSSYKCAPSLRLMRMSFNYYN